MPRSTRRKAADDGFALVEYVITIAITGLVVGALAAAMLVIFRSQSAAVTRHDEANGSLSLTNYFPMDVASTPPGGRATGSGLESGCGASSDAGFNVLRLTWTESIDSVVSTFRVSYRLVETTTGGELRRIECRDVGQGFGAARRIKVAYGLQHVSPSWTAGDSPAALSPLSGDANLTLTLTSIAGNQYSVQGSRFNPARTLNTIEGPTVNVALAATMSLSTPNYSTVGEVLTYTVTLSNVGAVPVTAIYPVFSNADAAQSCATVLAPSVSTSCTATHVVTQQDLDDGTITASLVAVGYYSVFVATAVAVNTVEAAGAPGLSAVLSSAAQGYSVDNAVLDLTLTVTNTGNITFTELTPNYPGTSTTTACSPFPLAPGQSATCQLRRTVTSGEYSSPVSISGTVTGVTTNFGSTEPIESATLSIAFLPEVKIAVSGFTATPSIISQAGDTVTLTATVANTGNVAISGLQVVYNRPVSNTSCPDTIARNASVVCTATYTVIQNDVDEGPANLTATISGSWTTYSSTASARTSLYTAGTPAITLLLTSTKDQYTSVGEVLPFTLRVTNVGSVTLTSISPSFPNAVPTGACAPLPLAPGATATCGASHTVTSGELGSNISTSATAFAGTASAGNARTTSASAVTVNFLARPQLLVETYTASPSPFTAVDQLVTLTVAITNSGNVTLTNLTTTYGGATATSSCPSTLAVGATATCTSTRTTSTADAMAGFTATIAASARYGTTTVTSNGSTSVPSAVPCTVLTSSTAAIGNPATIGRTGTGANKSYLLSDVNITLQTTALCTGLRIKYYTGGQSAVTATLTSTSPGVWEIDIPGQASAGASTWNKGAVRIDVLPPASVGSAPIYTNTAAFTVN